MLRVVNDLFDHPSVDETAIIHLPEDLQELPREGYRNWKRVVFIKKTPFGENFVPIGLVSNATIFVESTNECHVFRDNLAHGFFNIPQLRLCSKLILTCCTVNSSDGGAYDGILGNEMPNLKELHLSSSHVYAHRVKQLLATNLEVFESKDENTSSWFFHWNVTMFPKLRLVKCSTFWLDQGFFTCKPANFPKLQRIEHMSKPEKEWKPWRLKKNAHGPWVVMNSIKYVHDKLVKAKLYLCVALKRAHFPKDLRKLICSHVPYEWFAEETKGLDFYLDKLALASGGCTKFDYRLMQPKLNELNTANHNLMSFSRMRERKQNKLRQTRDRDKKKRIRRNIEALDVAVSEADAQIAATEAFLKTYLKKRKLKK